MDKIGLHIIGGWSGNLGKPRVIKLVNVSAQYAAQVRGQVGPQTLVVVRWIETEQPLDNPAARAQQFVARHQSEMLSMRSMSGPNIAFEGYNEVPDHLAAQYAVFEAERLRIMHSLSLRSVVGNFSVGTPDLAKWAVYQPMLAALRPGDFLGLHEYWCDQFDIANRWHCGRWNKVPELAGVPIVVTECGRDQVEGKGKPGWRQTCDANQFLSDLWAYDELLEASANVLGATVFTAGNDPRWRDFDPSPIWPHVVAGYSDPQTYPQMAVPTSYPAQVIQAPGVTYDYRNQSHNYESRQNTPVTYLVMHDTEGSLSATLSWFANSNSQASAHDVIDESGVCHHLIDYDQAAWHAGGPTSKLNPGANLKSIGVELVYPAAPANPPWPQVQLAAAVLHCREIVRAFAIARDHVVRHADIDPTRRTDPRNFPWQWFLDQLYAPEVNMDTIIESIRKAAWAQGGTVYNPTAAFPAYARVHNLGAPMGPETDTTIDGCTYRWQRFANGIVYAKVGDWANVGHASW